MASRKKKPGTTPRKRQPETTSTGEKVITSSLVGDCWSLFLPLDPVPASRPRFARSGRVYYGKNYTRFRREADVLFSESEFPVEFPLSGPLVVSSNFVVRPPKTTKRISPRGDVDNYFKTLDVLNGFVWWDDDQLVWASMGKTFGDTPGIQLEVLQVVGIPETRTLPEMFLKGQSG